MSCSEASFSLTPIGHIETPYLDCAECPKNSRYSEHDAVIVLKPDVAAAMLQMDQASHLIVLYWLNQSDRSVLRHVTPYDSEVRGVFATRSPNRPNPIGFAVVELKSVEGQRLAIGPMDCVNGTPLLDIKPYIAANDSHPGASVGWLNSPSLQR